LEGWSGSPTCDVNVCAAVSVYAQTIHVFASDYTSNKNHEQFVIHDGATFTGFSGQKQMGSSSSHYIFNDFIVLSGGAINCSGYAVSTDLNAPANDGKRRLGLHGTIWVAAGGILDLESCIEGDPTSMWAKWTLVRYEVGVIINLGKLEDSMMLHYASGIQSRVQCPLDAGIELLGYNVCGDSMRTGVELGQGFCDDGNTNDGDGCSSRCTVEEWFSNITLFDVRDPRFKNCKLSLTWREIRLESGRFHTGGLGQLLVENKMEAWVCDKAPNCLSDVWASSFEGQILCFVYMKESNSFVPIGLNSDMKFVKNSAQQENAMLVEVKRKIGQIRTEKKVRTKTQRVSHNPNIQKQMQEMMLSMEKQDPSFLQYELSRLNQGGNTIDESVFLALISSLEPFRNGVRPDPFG